MEISIASIVASLGIMFGLNFIGLFIAAYVLDRQATYVLSYVAGGIALIAGGFAYLLSTITPYPAPFIVLVEVCLALGIIGFAHGFAKAFSIRVNWLFLWSLFAVGAVLTITLYGQNEMSVGRLVAVSAWHGIATFYVVVLLLRLPHAALKHRFIAGTMALTGLSIILRPIISAVVQMDTNLSLAGQVELYGSVASTVYLVAVFSLVATIFFHVMSELVARYQRASVTDSMTGLLNRHGFFQAVEPVKAFPASIIMIDIDHFKSVNDRFGHDVGDRVIAAVGAILRQAVDAPHVSGRLGGEEFAVVLLHTETPTAQALAQSLRLAVEVQIAQMLSWDETITASFGIAPISEGGLDTALLKADRALYRAKHDGRNRVCVAEPADTPLTTICTKGRRYSGGSSRPRTAVK